MHVTIATVNEKEMIKSVRINAKNVVLVNIENKLKPVFLKEYFILTAHAIWCNNTLHQNFFGNGY